MNHRPAQTRAGFGAPAGARLAMTIGYAVAAACGVLWVQGRAAETGTAEPAPAPESIARTAALELTASFGVAEWNVTVGGQPMKPTTQSASTWSGELPLDSGAPAEVLIEALRDDPLAENADALRVQWRDGERTVERTYWAQGGVTVLLDPAKESAR